MTQQKQHLDVAREIDYYLFQDVERGIASKALDEKGNYRDWYASLLTSIALLAGSELPVFAFASPGTSETDVHIIVFTANLVFVADVETDADAVPLVRALNRRSIVGIKLSASERIDARDRRSHEWPGSIYLRLEFGDLIQPLEIVGDGANRHAVDKPSPIVTLIESLSADVSRGV